MPRARQSHHAAPRDDTACTGWRSEPLRVTVSRCARRSPSCRARRRAACCSRRPQPRSAATRRPRAVAARPPRAASARAAWRTRRVRTRASPSACTRARPTALAAPARGGERRGRPAERVRTVFRHRRSTTGGDSVLRRAGVREQGSAAARTTTRLHELPQPGSHARRVRGGAVRLGARRGVVGVGGVVVLVVVRVAPGRVGAHDDERAVRDVEAERKLRVELDGLLEEPR